MKSLNLTKPHLIVMVGIPGAGKSFFAEQFAETFKAPIINSENLRRSLFDIPSHKKDEDVVVEKISDLMLQQIFQTDRTIVYVGQTSSRNERAAITKKARTAGYEPLFIWVQTEPITAKKRSLKPTIKSNAISPELFDEKLRRFSPPHQNEKVVVISGKHTFATQLKVVLKRLVEPREKIAIRPPQVQRPTRARNILIR